MRAGSEGDESEEIIDVVCGARFSIIFTVSGTIVICDHGGGNPTEATLQLAEYLQGAKSVSHEQSSFDLPKVAFVSEKGQLYIQSDGREETTNMTVEKIPQLVKGLSHILCKQVSIGHSHAAVLTEGKKVWTFGDNTYGQIGQGERVKKCTVPSLVHAFLDTIEIDQLACGRFFTTALSTSGYVYSWGKLTRFSKIHMLPRLITALQNWNAVQISCYHEQCGILISTDPSPVRQEQEEIFNEKDSDVKFTFENTNEPPIFAKRSVLSSKNNLFARNHPLPSKVK